MVFNTYGPTEATESASLAELHAHQPVTIGKPLPNYGLLVIQPAVENGLALVPRGEVGELCNRGGGHLLLIQNPEGRPAFHSRRNVELLVRHFQKHGKGATRGINKLVDGFDYCFVFTSNRQFRHNIH